MRGNLFPLLIAFVVLIMPGAVLALDEEATEVDSTMVAEGDSTTTDSTAIDSTMIAEEDSAATDTTDAVDEAVEEEVAEEQGGFFSKFAEFFRQGGPAMWAILFFFGVGTVIFIERVVFLFGIASAKPEALMARIATLIRKGSIEGAIAATSEEKSPLSKIIEAALRNYKGTERDIQNAVDEMALAEIPRINARIGYLGMLANVSTMVGLLGTIFGLIAAFAAVAAADPEQKGVLLANGISQAMNTTAFGLIAAIPMLVAHSVLTSKADSLVDDIDRYSVMVMNMLSQARREG
ncbi:MAG: MotA/TolQ/ExbB proton channel family protein [Candidatus Fermentibacteraceae bacterium]|nr:MotA/TolQ/ExbB proton channel family protein [Candidatus Fermentibacteraceae bacterium]